MYEVIGSGAYGMVRKCQNKQSDALAAVKTINKSRVRDVVDLKREIEILRTVNHPNIIRLYDVYEDTYFIHLVTELCTGGELYDRVIDKADSEEGHYSEEDASCLVRDILGAIAYCHDVVKIVHRDLKPENFLLLDKRDDAPIKIIDFGLSRFDDSPFGIMNTRVGSPYYVAPEVLQGAYTNKCDIWSIGVITYLLLCGFAPFNGDDDGETFFMIENATLVFPSPEWDDISPLAKDFVKALLDRDPNKRIPASAALQHPWIHKGETVPGIPIPRPFSSESRKASSVRLYMHTERKSAFQKFLANIKVSKAISGLTDGLTCNEARVLGDVFKRVDKDRNGIIHLDDIDETVASGKRYFTL
jgi:calcium-dependent protein kinase